MDSPESRTQKSSPDDKSIYRGYIDNPQKTLEIVEPGEVKTVISDKLDDVLKDANIDEKKQNKIREIIYTFLDKLDQKHILKGHVRGIQEGLIPALIENKDCVKSFFDYSAFIKGFDHENDSMSTNDFIFQSLTRKCKPSNFSRMVYRSKKMLAVDSHKILQNRKDAELLDAELGFNALREMIHDQKSSGISIILAMIEFYETGDTSTLGKEVIKWNQRYPEDDLSRLFIYELYDKTFPENRKDANSLNLKTINVLYRLRENLLFVGFEHPVTPNEELNNLLDKTSANTEYPSIESLRTYENPLLVLNNILISSIKREQIGIDPSYFATINWIRERIGMILAELPFEAIETLYKENTLKETLRLMELTASSIAYDEKDFEEFASNYQKQETFIKAYELICRRSLSRQSQTATYFRKNLSSDYKFGGNLTRDEISLTNENIEKQLQSLGYLNNHKPITNKGRDRWHSALGMS